MFSRKMMYGFLFIFLFLSFAFLYQNMPEPKNKRIYNEILEYFPYEITKEFGGLDIVNKKTGEDIDVANAKVFIVFDDLLKKWGKDHIKLEGNTIRVLDDNNKTVKTIEIKDEKELRFVLDFFGLEKNQNR
ncbi:hypothetical protein [Nitrosophilus alvini]|uniref:hypothetical protein n=1 Tax=Nitrosophilus alvini TaxID=2714855 RepID=UPI001909BA6E|nr:hypothetical protein [Nitrosophilus alvini]